MSKHGRIAALAVPVKVLRSDGADSHCDSDEAIVVYPDPDDIEPRQTALRRAPGAPLAAAASREPVQRPHPRLDGLHVTEIFLLVVQRGCHVVAEQGEEGRYREGFVAIAYDLEVYRVPVEPEREEGRRGVYGHHEEDADDVFLFPRFRVMCRVHHDEVDGHDYRDEARAGGYDESELVEGQGACDRFLGIGQNYVERGISGGCKAADEGANVLLSSSSVELQINSSCILSRLTARSNSDRSSDRKDGQRRPLSLSPLRLLAGGSYALAPVLVRL